MKGLFPLKLRRKLALQFKRKDPIAFQVALAAKEAAPLSQAVVVLIIQLEKVLATLRLIMNKYFRKQANSCPI